MPIMQNVDRSKGIMSLIAREDQIAVEKNAIPPAPKIQTRKNVGQMCFLKIQGYIQESVWNAWQTISVQILPS